MLKNIERTQLKTNARHPLNTLDEKEDQMFAYRDGNENRYQQTERLGISTKGNIMFMFMFLVFMLQIRSGKIEKITEQEDVSAK